MFEEPEILLLLGFKIIDCTDVSGLQIITKILYVMKKTLDEYKKDVSDFFDKINNGDKYATSVPDKESGLQLDLYKYLLGKHYDVVYELELPDLKQYLKESINESEKMFSYLKGSLRPDIVVKLDDENFASIELKYNEDNKDLHEYDKDKNRVYVEQCLEIHYAERIHLHGKNIHIEGLDDNVCEDTQYVYSDYCYSGSLIKKGGLNKSEDAYSIKGLWEEKLKQIKDKKGEFSKYGY